MNVLHLFMKYTDDMTFYIKGLTLICYTVIKRKNMNNRLENYVQ